jgi:hypothetical protein
MMQEHEYLNEVRARAFGDNNHNITASGAALADFIQAERRWDVVKVSFL